MTPLDAWRAADLALREARRLVEAETLRVAREGREVYRRYASPARRVRLPPVPDDLLSGRVGPRVLEGQWSDLLTPAQREAARPELEALAAEAAARKDTRSMLAQIARTCSPEETRRRCAAARAYCEWISKPPAERGPAPTLREVLP